MTTILHRTVFYEQKGGPVRFHDFARVVTTAGVCAEPFLVNNKIPFSGFDDFDPDGEMTRIDEMQGIDMDKEKLILSGGDEVIHGGVCIPRSGR